MNNRGFSSVALVVLVVVLAGVVGYFVLSRKSVKTPTDQSVQVTTQSPSSQTNNTIDCGTDQNCFIKYFKTCTPAKWLIKTDATWIIKGGSIGSCEVSTEGPGPSDEMTCRMDVSVYEKFASDNPKAPTDAVWGMYVLGNLKSNCQGPLKDKSNLF